uniref:Uncharacterized protein n=1 Tax=Physcomitrium patens TaxID=3218 RepID=A0A2K1KIW4_PHYPA|nr:hypothetical protein PHYPA_007380 [Physcomitrium patens]
MEVMDLIIATSKMLAGPNNYKIWSSTIWSMIENEDLLDVMVPNIQYAIGIPSKKQPIMALSSSEAKYWALVDDFREAI